MMIFAKKNIEIERNPSFLKKLRNALDLPGTVKLEFYLDDLMLELSGNHDVKLIINKRQVPPGRRILLGGEILKYGLRKVRLLPPGTNPGIICGGTGTIARSILFSEPGKKYIHGPAFTVLEGPAAGRRWPLAEGMQTIGRNAAADIVLTDKTVSGQHATVEWLDGKISMEDSGSRHGIRLGGKKISRKTIIKNHEEILLGSCIIRLDIPDKPRKDAKPKKTDKFDRWLMTASIMLLIIGGAVSMLASAS